jgi:hypothetical protein
VMNHAGRKEPYAPAPVARVVGRSFGAITRQLTIRQPVTKSVCDTNMSGPEGNDPNPLALEPEGYY